MLENYKTSVSDRDPFSHIPRPRQKANSSFKSFKSSKFHVALDATG